MDFGAVVDHEDSRDEHNENAAQAFLDTTTKDSVVVDIHDNGTDPIRETPKPAYRKDSKKKRKRQEIRCYCHNQESGEDDLICMICKLAQHRDCILGRGRKFTEKYACFYCMAFRMENEAVNYIRDWEVLNSKLHRFKSKDGEIAFETKEHAWCWLHQALTFFFRHENEDEKELVKLWIDQIYDWLERENQ